MSRFKSKIDKYDKTFSEFIRLRDGCCQWCGKYRGDIKKLECSHIFSRRHQGTRCDPKNAKALCSYHHQMWHSNPVEAAECLKGIIGQGEYDRLRLKANKVCKMKVWDKDYIRAEQNEMIEEFENGTVRPVAFNPVFRIGDNNGKKKMSGDMPV